MHVLTGLVAGFFAPGGTRPRLKTSEHSGRPGLIGLITVCVLLCAALPLCAQSRVPSREVELPPVEIWEEQTIEVQLQQPSDDAFVDLPVTPVRPSRGGIGGGPLGGPSGSDSPFSAYSFIQIESNLRNQPGTLRVRGEGFSAGVPVSIGPNGIWILSTRVEHDVIQTDALLPESTLPFPDELWNINLSLKHIHPFDNGWTAGGMVGIGSASDQPFASIREMNANMLAFLSIPTRESDSWNFRLCLKTNSSRTAPSYLSG